MSKKGVQYTFEGQYYTGSKDTAEQIKNYQLEVVFPEETDKALSIFKTAIRNPLSPICKMMVGKYSDFKAIRTYVITDVKNMDGSNTTEASKNVATMNTKQLTAYIKKNELGLDVEVYEGDITRLRNAIVAAETDPENFKEQYKADVEAYEFNKSLNALNDVPDGADKGPDKADDKTDDDNKDADELDAADLLGDTDGADNE